MTDYVHARFRVSQYTRFPSWHRDEPLMNKFALHGVQGEPFGSATPSASMEMVIANPEAAALFITALESGTELDVTFSLVPQPAPKPAPAPAPEPVAEAPAPAPLSEPVAAASQVVSTPVEETPIEEMPTQAQPAVVPLQTAQPEEGGQAPA